MIWLVDPAVAHLERLERAAVAQPVGDELAEESRLQEAMEDHPGQSHAFRVSLVVMDLVEVALRARVLHQLARGRVLDQLGDLRADRQVHRRIAVPRSRATVRPCWFLYSVSKMMNSSVPLPPLFS